MGPKLYEHFVATQNSEKEFRGTKITQNKFIQDFKEA